MSAYSIQKLVLLIFFLFSLPSFAYVGPGIGLTAIGCLIALIAGLWYTFFGFIWLPIKRKFFKSNKEEQDLNIDNKTQTSSVENSKNKVEN